MEPETNNPSLGNRFAKGTSGNPAGRPRGSRNKATLLFEALLEGETEALTQKAIELAKNGEPAALRLCLERIYPPRRDTPVAFRLPSDLTLVNLGEVTGSILQAVAHGEMTPSQAETVMKIVAAHTDCLRTQHTFGEIAKRHAAEEATRKAADASEEASEEQDWNLFHDYPDPDPSAPTEQELLDRYQATPVPRNGSRRPTSIADPRESDLPPLHVTIKPAEKSPDRAHPASRPLQGKKAA